MPLVVTAGILGERMSERLQDADLSHRASAARCETTNVRLLSIDRAAAEREIVKRPAYTQGLIFVDGELYESTGKKGHSAIYRLDTNGGPRNELNRLDKNLFGEGLSKLGDRFYQLTWRAGLAFAYSYDSERARLTRVSTYQRDGEGWGLTSFGDELVLSDGSHRLSFIEPKTFAVNRIVSVQHAGQQIENLNELEFARGEILANIYGDNNIVGIDPQGGCVSTIIDASGLISDMAADLAGVREPICGNPCSKLDFVLNGIAYDAIENELYITGKNWPLIFVYRNLFG